MLFFLSNSTDATCDYLCDIADTKGIQYIRFDTDFKNEDLKIEFNSKNNISLQYKGKAFSPMDINCIWNRRPEKIFASNYGDSVFDEHFRNEWRHAFDGFIKQIQYSKWINHPFANASALSKVEQLKRAQEFGLKIPKTIVTQSYDYFKKFYDECNGSIITKPISHGYINKDDIVFNIYTNSIDIKSCSFEFFDKCPNLFQEKILKKNDIRVSYIDGIIESVELLYSESGEQRLDIRRKNMEGVCYKKIKLPVLIETQLINFVKSYNLRFAAIDLCTCVNNDIVFFEVNPNGQWAWMDILNVCDFGDTLLKSMTKGSSYGIY